MRHPAMGPGQGPALRQHGWGGGRLEKRMAHSPRMLTVDTPLVALKEIEWQRMVGHSPCDELAQHLHRQTDRQTDYSP